MAPPTLPRLPLAPARPHLRAIAHDRHQPHAGDTAALVDLLGVSHRVAQRYTAAGELPEHRADELAAALGLHPLNLWPDEWASLTEGATTP